MNKIWFKKLRDTGTFNRVPDGFKTFIHGGYQGFFIPASKEGWIVIFIFLLVTLLSVGLVVNNEFSRVVNFIFLAFPLVICIFIAKVKS